MRLQRFLPKTLWLGLVSTIGLLTFCQTMPHFGTNDANWQWYKDNLITASGQVVDTGNNNISHSEGQGYGMLLATYADDEKTFRRIWHWTKKNLQVRQDFLFAWQYQPDKGVVDRNNASDGDILIAWALLKAAKQWRNEVYRKQGKHIIVDIRNKLIRQWHGKNILLPGEFGFEEEDAFTINLSYWVYPALADFQEIDTSPLWAQLIEDGLLLQKEAGFGRWQLPPDWIDLQKDINISTKYQPTFGYDAVRIPLYTLWLENEFRSPKRIGKYLNYWQQGKRALGFLPASVNLLTDQYADYPAPKGIENIYNLLEVFAKGDKYQTSGLLDQEDDYYSATLCLLTNIVAQKLVEER